MVPLQLLLNRSSTNQIRHENFSWPKKTKWPEIDAPPAHLIVCFNKIRQVYDQFSLTQKKLDAWSTGARLFISGSFFLLEYYDYFLVSNDSKAFK